MKKERQRWSAEEDNLLRAYVRTYGPREWHLISQRMNAHLDRDAKSCLERWKNYLKPGIKKGSLTEEEQRLVIRLQAKHGNKWKKIAAEVPGRTAKRLGKWWEVYKEKQLRDLNKKKAGAGIGNHNGGSGSCNSSSSKAGALVDPIEERKYDTILQNFAEKLVRERAVPPAVVPTFLMPTSNGSLLATTTGFLHNEPPPPPRPHPHHHHPPPPPTVPAPTMLPAWLSSNNSTASASSSPTPTHTTPTPSSCCVPSSPSVTLSLASSTMPPAQLPWLHPDQRTPDHHRRHHHNNNNNNNYNYSPLTLNALSPISHGSTIQIQHQPNHITNGGGVGDHHSTLLVSPAVHDLVECCRELEEGHRAWAAHRKEASWRLKRVELQLESEKACRRREKMEEIEAQMKALREEQKLALERIEAEYREQLAGLRRDAEVKEHKLADQWAAKHLRLVKFLEQMGCSSSSRGHAT